MPGTPKTLQIHAGMKVHQTLPSSKHTTRYRIRLKRAKALLYASPDALQAVTCIKCLNHRKNDQ